MTVIEKADPVGTRPAFRNTARGLKVLLFHFAEFGGLGGVEIVVLRLAEGFAASGNPAGIVELAKSNRPRRTLDSGTRVWPVTAPSYPALDRPRSWASFARATLQFHQIVREFDPDIVHVHFPLAQSLPVIGAQAFRHRWRLVVTVHNSDIRVAPYQEPRIRPWQRRIFQRADAVTAVNRALLEDAVALFPSIHGKGKVILNGVGQEWFQPLETRGPREPYILFSGRLHHVKGVDLLLEAWGAISRQFPDIELWIAGDGEDRRNLEVLARDLGLAKSVVFLGRKNQQELARLYRNALAVVLPSRREGLPLTLLEAGAAGAICVGNRTPGIPEIIEDGVNGYVVNAESSEELGAGLARVLLLSAAERSRMEQAAQARVMARYSEGRMVAEYLELFRSLRGKT